MSRESAWLRFSTSLSTKHIILIFLTLPTIFCCVLHRQCPDRWPDWVCFKQPIAVANWVSTDRLDLWIKIYSADCQIANHAGWVTAKKPEGSDAPNLAVQLFAVLARSDWWTTDRYLAQLSLPAPISGDIFVCSSALVTSRGSWVNGRLGSKTPNIWLENYPSSDILNLVGNGMDRLLHRGWGWSVRLIFWRRSSIPW